VRVRRFFKLLVIAVAIITAVTLVGTKLGTRFSAVATALAP
jgi:Flp pilus assembly pilin Flp